jgi:hypothetical protein
LAQTGGPPTTKEYSFDEYKLYYETTERVIDRRIALNNWNYGVCVAILVGLGLIANWTTTNEKLQMVALVWIVVMSVLGMVLCRYWVKRLEDLKALNDVKFEILNKMAPAVAFDEHAKLKSAEPFANEWIILTANKATKTVKNGTLTVLRASGAEFLTPYAFGIIFLSSAILACVVTIGNWPNLSASPFELTSQKKEQAHSATTIVGSDFVYRKTDDAEQQK